MKYLTKTGVKLINELKASSIRGTLAGAAATGGPRIGGSSDKSDIGGAGSMTRAGMAPSPHTRSRIPGRANVTVGNRTKEPTAPIDGGESPEVPYADQNKAINIASQRVIRLPSGGTESGLNTDYIQRGKSTLPLTSQRKFPEPRLIRKTSDIDKEQRMTDRGANPFAPGRVLGTGPADPLQTTAQSIATTRRQIDRYKKMDAYEVARKSGTTMHKPIMDPQVRRVPGNIAYTRERFQPPAETPVGHKAANTPQVKAKTMEKRGKWVHTQKGRFWVEREMMDSAQKDVDAEANKVRRDA